MLNGGISMLKSVLMATVLMIGLLTTSGCQEEQAQYTESPIDVFEVEGTISIEKKEEMINAIVQAEKVLKYPYSTAIMASPFGEEVPLFSEEFQTKTDVFLLFSQYWAENMADNFANETVDLSNSDESIGLAGHKENNWRTIFEANPNSIRVTYANDYTGIVDMEIPGERQGFGTDIRLQYVLMRDTAEQSWKIAEKTVLNKL